MKKFIFTTHKVSEMPSSHFRGRQRLAIYDEMITCLNQGLALKVKVPDRWRGKSEALRCALRKTFVASGLAASLKTCLDGDFIWFCLN